MAKAKTQPLSPNITKSIDSIRPADCGEFETSDREAQRIRSFLYSINKDGIRRYRTIRDGAFLRVWRIK